MMVAFSIFFLSMTVGLIGSYMQVMTLLKREIDERKFLLGLRIALFSFIIALISGGFYIAKFMPNFLEIPETFNEMIDPFFLISRSTMDLTIGLIVLAFINIHTYKKSQVENKKILLFVSIAMTACSILAFAAIIYTQSKL